MTTARRAKKPRAAVYIRVSTDRQNGGNQEKETLALCKRQGWRPFTFAEVASGAKDRSVWATVVRRANRGEFAAVVTWALDRMGRTFYGIHDAIRSFDEHGVTVATVCEPWLLEGVESDHRALMVSQFAWAAAFERKRLTERINAGLDRARRQGKKLGRPIVLDHATAEKACKLRAGGSSWRSIAAELNRQGHRTIRGKKLIHTTVMNTVRAVVGQGSE